MNKLKIQKGIYAYILLFAEKHKDAEINLVSVKHSLIIDFIAVYSAFS
jgi:hypothetical protein